jgi:hypothetical protein
MQNTGIPKPDVCKDSPSILIETTFTEYFDNADFNSPCSWFSVCHSVHLHLILKLLLFKFQYCCGWRWAHPASNWKKEVSFNNECTTAKGGSELHSRLVGSLARRGNCDCLLKRRQPWIWKSLLRVCNVCIFHECWNHKITAEYASCFADTQQQKYQNWYVYTTF